MKAKTNRGHDEEDRRDECNVEQTKRKGLRKCESGEGAREKVDKGGRCDAGRIQIKEKHKEVSWKLNKKAPNSDAGQTGKERKR